MEYVNRQLLLDKRPTGMPEDNCWKMNEEKISSLQNNEICGAGLDVFENEPNVPDDLINLNNVILTPHIGSATVETRYDMGKLVYDNIVQMLTTNTTISPVN